LTISNIQIATETECWHNMRVAVTTTGTPFWALKYLPESAYGSVDFRDIAIKIVDNIQLFISQESVRENTMSSVIQLFSGHGKLRKMLKDSF